MASTARNSSSATRAVMSGQYQGRKSGVGGVFGDCGGMTASLPAVRYALSGGAEHVAVPYRLPMPTGATKIDLGGESSRTEDEAWAAG